MEVGWYAPFILNHCPHFPRYLLCCCIIVLLCMLLYSFYYLFKERILEDVRVCQKFLCPKSDYTDLHNHPLSSFAMTINIILNFFLNIYLSAF